ncbi:MAG: molybdopterin-synthase adenylyltransferase MoeB [Actinobacteria bacterium]|nr:MAG: molybdopterin-synthase adenylyltransferase MoeB [Actinomycetota bacterium]
MFNSDEKERYARHFILPEIGEAGQKKIKDAKVLVVGTGGLGSPVDFYLAAAGVGTLGIVDADVVDASNLQRQILHFTDDIGKEKTLSAKDKLKKLNPNVNVITYQQKALAQNVEELVANYDIIVDCTDNFPARFLLNDAAYFAGKPLVHGAIFRFDGSVTTIKPNEGPCYRCIYHQPPAPSKQSDPSLAGLIGSVPGIVGTIMATETLKLITGVGRPLVGKLLSIDTLHMEFTKVNVRKDPKCPLCGTKSITGLVDHEHATNIDLV